MSKEAIEALEAARAHILDAYRIWQADDVSAVPPPKSGAGAVIAKIDAVLSSPIAGEGKAEPRAWFVKDFADGWIHFDNEADAKRQIEATGAIWYVAHHPALISSPGKDGGQQVEAVDDGPLTVSYPVHEIAHNLLLAHTGSEGGSPTINWYGLRAEIADAIAVALDKQRRLDTQPASTALVERLSREGEKDVEAVAEKLFAAYNSRLVGSYGGKWSDIGGPVKARWVNEARSVLAGYSDRPQPAKLTIKPLPWREKLGMWSAQTDFVACYSVWNVDVGRWECSLLDGSFDTVEDAKNAAQADYDRRILSSIMAGGSHG